MKPASTSGRQNYMNKALSAFRFIAATSILSVAITTGLTGNYTDTLLATPAVKLSGYIKSDFIFDSRQNQTIRENMFLLYPLPVSADEQGRDVNDVRNFQFIPFQTRLSAAFSGTSVLNARASGLIEGEFFGTTDADLNGFRLRHAAINLHWESGISILMGQFWHPLFITGCFPTTASFNTGVPFNPFSRNPQFEVSYTTQRFRYSATAVSQLEFRSTGPAGPSTRYQRNSGLPELTGKIYYFGAGGDLLIGAASSYKLLRPRIADDSGNKVNEQVGSGVLMAFSRYTRGNKTIKAAGILGQDLFHLTMTGGYAIRVIDDPSETLNPSREFSYSPFSVFSAWAEFVTGDTWEAGLFTGYSQNLGAADVIAAEGHLPVIFTRGTDLNFLYRISPRLSYKAYNVRVGIETEYTRAFYSQTFDNHGKPLDANGAGNLRLLFFAFYSF